MFGKILLLIIFLLSWFGLGLQLYIMLHQSDGSSSTFGILVNYFSFFTILTNLIVAVSSSFALLAPASKAGKFFASPRTRTAITIYIVIVGIVYSIVLRDLWKPEGWQLVADRILHDINPILYFIFWLVAVPGKSLHWKNIGAWLIYPILYSIYAVFRGLITGWYAYPFLDARALGATRVLLNMLVIALAFIFVSLVFVAINQSSKKPPQHKPLL